MSCLFVGPRREAVYGGHEGQDWGVLGDSQSVPPHCRRGGLGVDLRTAYPHPNCKEW